MPAHRSLTDLHLADFLLDDPGDAGTIKTSRDRAVCLLTSSTSETRTLNNPIKAGLRLTLALTSYGGAIQVSTQDSTPLDANSNSAVVLTAAGSWVDLLALDIGGTLQWRVTGHEGTTGIAVDIAYDNSNGYFLSATTVQDAIDVLGLHLTATSHNVAIPLFTWREASTFDVGAIAANGGVLASDTTPILEAISAGTDGCQRIHWAAGVVDQIITQVVLPANLDRAENIVLKTRIASSGTQDALGFTVETFFNEGDTKVTDTSGTHNATAYSEESTTIAAGDVPSTAKIVTIGLTPVAHANDALYLSGTWLEYTGKAVSI